MSPLDRPPTRLDTGELRAVMGLSRERMARLLDVASKTVERLEAEDALPSREATTIRLARIQEVVDLGLQVYTSAGLRRFLATPFPVFDGLTALQLMERGNVEAVLQELAATYEGAVV